MFLPRLFITHEKLPGLRSLPRARIVVEPDWPRRSSPVCERTGHTLVVSASTTCLETPPGPRNGRTPYRPAANPRWLLLGSGGRECLARPSLRRGRGAEPCRGGGRCARTGRNRDTAAVCPARYRGAGAARSAAATRSPRWC